MRLRAAPLGAAGSPHPYPTPAVKGSRNLVSAALRRPRRVLMVFPRGVGTRAPPPRRGHVNETTNSTLNMGALRLSDFGSSPGG